MSDCIIVVHGVYLHIYKVAPCFTDQCCLIVSMVHTGVYPYKYIDYLHRLSVSDCINDVHLCLSIQMYEIAPCFIEYWCIIVSMLHTGAYQCRYIK